MKRYSRLLSLVQFLKNNLPLPYPLLVLRTKVPKGLDGDCSFKKDKFTIRIEKKLPEGYAIETVLHEYGHALAWDKEENVHGDTWGKAYSLVYRKFLEWDEQDIT